MIKILSRPETILRDVVTERQHQVAKWGIEFDDKNTINDWVSYITSYAGQAAFEDNAAVRRHKLIQVAALAVAAVEAFDRNLSFPNRHYDGDA